MSTLHSLIDPHPCLTELAKEYCEHISKDFLCTVAEACYWYLANWHEGQFSDKYAALCSLHYKPGLTHRGPQDEISKSIYEELVEELVVCENIKTATATACERFTAIRLVGEINATWNTLEE